MTTRELLYVKTVADTHNISKAAKQLFVAQPSLSQSLQRIEESIGTKIFIRGSYGLKLTYAGEKYYQMACKILKIYDDFEAEISDMNDLRTGHISFGITNHLGAITLPLVVPEFKTECPGIDFDIFEGSTELQEEKLIAGDLDFSVMHAPVDGSEGNPSLNYEILARHPFLVAISRNNPLVQQAVVTEGYPYPVLDVKLLGDQPLLTLHKEQRIRHVTDSVLKKAGIHPEIKFVSRNYMTLEKLAAEDIGFTLLPSDYVNVNKYDNPPAFLSIDDKYSAYWSLCITTLKGAFLSRADQRFIQIIREKVPARELKSS
ncbi:LysR family transcriptional regulator [Oribacterium sp. WCC10]|uniref:LysR family transcriptional regulator n=1 Tax=Oribacterium sp. WCC10 TaxID=1855343 RepID=UPI0008EFCD91|nr:LysR family transcriptional regulator [Oribacterium sp. WCC10]SFG79963.1 DNA-binding transcriptional regulator, LysR family [Oribacterium sp. WCC10]